MIHLCETCGKDMGNCSPSRKYCSPECERKSRKKRAAEKKSGNIRPKICPVCGKEFPQGVNKNKKYCSDACRKKANFPDQRVEKICPVCGKWFYPAGRQKYCSEECKAKEKLMKKDRGMTRLAYEAAEATAHGMSYGKYKAMKAG